jgi:hypothetical protein
MLFTECTNSQSQGNVGMGQAIAYYTQKGYTVSIPLNDCQEYDLVVEYPDGLKKVQVKTTKHKAPSGNYMVNLRTMSGYKDKYSYKIGAYDILFAVDEMGRTYEFTAEDLKNYKNCVTLK